MSSYVVPELGTNFQTDFDKLVRDYIYAQYNISDPSKTDTGDPSLTEPILNIKVGFFSYDKEFEIAVLETDWRVEQWGNAGRQSYRSTGIQISMRMRRIDVDKVDPQLGNMEREIDRIASQYQNYGIPGIKEMQPESGERVYEATDNWASSDWRSVYRLRLYYEKQDLS